MKRIVLSVIIAFVCLIAIAQVPQGLNYQAFAGDLSGTPIRNTDLQVKISILSDTLLPVTVWEELYSTVRTNSQGIFSLVIGSGVRQSSSSVATFNEIDWSATPLFIRTQIFYQGTWRNMGSAKLWTVPYAMVAENLSGTLKKLAVTGETANMDEALFEVKNKNGQTVFAVYNEGVRIYVDDGDAKGAKGGFAIGGFGGTKAGSQNYFVVKPDTIRMYIDDTPGKAAKGGFAIGGFGTAKSKSQHLFVVNPDSIRAYVDSNTSKGAKGGFAIGGFGKEKGLHSQKYLFVSEDSIRAYIDPNSGKSAKGGFAVGGFKSTKDLADNEYFHVTRDSTRIYVANPQKGGKGGFAVSSLDLANGKLYNFLDLTPNNYFIGHEAGLNNTTGLYNSFIGYQAGRENTSGKGNIFIGYQSGFSNLVGGENTFVGYQAGFSSIGNEWVVQQRGNYNCYYGYQAGYSSEYGDYNTIIGYRAGWNNLASINTFIGYEAGFMNIEGTYNTFIGVGAGYFNSSGLSNIFLGMDAGLNNTVGDDNIYMGTNAGAGIRFGNNNVILGSECASGDVYNQQGTGSSNVILGFQAGQSAKDGSSNVFIGNQSGYSETGSNLLYIDNSSTSNPLIWGDFSSNSIRINGDLCYTGTLGVCSDARYKKNIIEIPNALELLMRVRGVYYNWRQDEYPEMNFNSYRQIGVIAQEIEDLLPELVSTDPMGYEMIDYSKFTPLIIEAMKEQQKQTESYKNENDALKSQLQTLQGKVDKIEALMAKALGE